MKRIFSGIQPTGEIHIGNYVGAIREWVKLTGSYDCIYCVVDYHAITVEYNVGELAKRTIDTALALIACGLTPDKCKLFIQSQVPEHTELTWIFNCVTPVGDLERMTQFKEKSRQHKRNVNMGLMDYPVLQAADILIYKAELVPVGEDQIQHIELSREIARRFNSRFKPIFPEPKVILSRAPRILGIDGKSKMSKSQNNYIGILENEDSIWEKLRVAVTDTSRVRRYDKGNPELCNVFTIHTAFSEEDILGEVEKGCRTAQIGCIDCKKILFERIQRELSPIKERAERLKRDIGYVLDVVNSCAKDVRRIAKETIDEVREAIGLYDAKKNFSPSS
ncbi:MAG: tryptophan--tRNA ligase [Desulfobacterota bacterium]|nr:tryptophan--tRNA ligase [Thermodesulfobacteriota bacterium]MDW8002067.1 tryptophan--tRNA ligase [Deltaproteobacteria bacterium]